MRTPGPTSRDADPPRAEVVVVSTALGIALDFANVNPVKALYWAAIINGWLAPFVLAGVLLVASSRRLMRNQPAPTLGRAAVALTLILMLAAGVGLRLF